MNSNSDTDSDQSESGSEPRRRYSDLSDSIFRSYLEYTGNSSTATDADLAKIQSFLTSSSSGALSCLICLERIRPGDPTWSCTAVCYTVLHLFCIQSWARKASGESALRASTRLPISAAKAAESALWNCPKCRTEYTQSQIPKSYTCYCGKVADPKPDPWILPHSCGEVCGRPLRPDCGHLCLLLCHPGPCPPCPQQTNALCFCRSVSAARRCGYKSFTCKNPCKKLLSCGAHSCPETCHDGQCPPCPVRAVFRCQCGKKEEMISCHSRPDFRCEEGCQNLLDCGIHRCGKGCHPGKCGGCPLQGTRTCPCGKRVHEGLSCKDVVPLCGATCGKMLACGYHRCPERCHRGECIMTCREVVLKSCRCGSFRKEVPCHQDLACEKKCQRDRDCGRHQCRRRCCDGDCPPCSLICGKMLRCKNHKCPSPCHSGYCAPCPVMVTITCLCSVTHFQVPCGAEKNQKPPRCRKSCPITPLCRHGANKKPHKCHYGACRPCTLICEEEYPCGHKCKQSCHGPKPPPNPEFTLKPKKKKLPHPIEITPGTPCPPCKELVWRSCVGQHHGADRMMICSDKTLFSCDNLCGNPLPCGNHFCTKTCHPLENQLWPLLRQARSVPCEECSHPCEKEREPGCNHPCPLKCHPGDCHPCKVLVKRRCYCRSMVNNFECKYYNSLSEKEQMAVFSCKGLCHSGKLLPYCTHLCPESCHPGQCSSPEKCSKKVTVRCGCQTLKREWVCHDVQAAYRTAGSDPKDIPKNQFGLGLIPCEENCKSKQKVVDSELQLRKPKAVEVKEPDTDKPAPKRKKRRERVEESKQITALQKSVAHMKRILLVVTILVVLVAASYYGYKGLLQLSDWMNEVEEKKQRRYPRRG